MSVEDCNESSEVKDTSEVKQQMTVDSQLLLCFMIFFH
jgi:hypothetical protein